MRELKRKRAECHEQLGEVRNLTLFVMQGVAFWQEMNMLTKAATVQTKRVQSLMDQAAIKNTVKILSSGGTKTKMRSFKESWLEVAEMVNENRLVLVLNGKQVKDYNKT